MKEATGELNMTVVTVVAIAAVGAFFYGFIWPGIKTGLMKNTCNNICPAGVNNAEATASKNQDGTYTCTCADENKTTFTIDKNGNTVES
jgi:hypothetical protein